MKAKFSISGPGVLVAAAFIGPGTVTVCSIAGVTFGFALIWAIVLSVIATIVLQEMAARLGLIARKGLSEIIRNDLNNPIVKWGVIILIVSSIIIGNAAYEAGNISGGVLGLESLGYSGAIEVGTFSINYWSIIIGLLAGILLYIGSYKVLERVLVSLVIVMSVAFIVTAIVTKPDVIGMLKGAVIPSFPEESTFTVIALIGTTVVPYNLFLHASLVSEKWKSADDLPTVRQDTIVAIILGGLVSMAIMISAAAIKGGSIATAADLAKSLEPLFGNYATYFIGVGLGAAGLTSAITAPLAAAYVAQGCFGWGKGTRDWRFRTVWVIILLLGIFFSSAGYKPVDIIKFAQVANGILLPVIAGYLIYMANKKQILGVYINTRVQNVIGIAVWLIVFGLGLKSILKVFGIL